ncbi:purine-nucleoside phosphorylase [Roseimaritima ulvae]|uniref:purine-nucleoside phosphorylase n=1 Tax=Roseimaritima ulvae TaxID=980254 RepID=UPI0008308BA3|nr:purine-nucleoside phosphorylase [Roseimaritima ulvae]
MPNLAPTLSMIRQRTDLEPRFGIILGSGLGGLADAIEQPQSWDFADLPGFGKSTAGGHRGQLVLGRLAGVPVVAMAGRLHRYGGWSTQQVSFPVAVMHGLGATRLIVSNAAGGVNPKYRVGDIVVIADHMDWMHGNPAARFAARPPAAPAPADPPLAPAVDTLHRSRAVYDPAMLETALRASWRGGFTAYPGTYLATLGPNYETRAEYRMMRRLGADVVGMSTVPEVLAAVGLQMRVLALSMVSNVACPDAPNVANHEEVLAAGAAAEPRMRSIVAAVLAAEREC